VEPPKPPAADADRDTVPEFSDIPWLPLSRLSLPTLLFLGRARIVNWYSYAIAGLVVALTAALAGFVLFVFSDSGQAFTVQNLLQTLLLPVRDPRVAENFLMLPSIYGPMTALVFWLIVRPDRPSRQSPGGV
jgi:hypothetical protein